MTNFISNGISVYLDRPNLFYWAGETISGTAKLNVTEGKVEEDEIYIQVTGEIGYTTTTVAGDSDVIIDYHNVPFYSGKAVIWKSKGGQKDLMFDQREYSCPFQIPLDNHLPPTICQPESYPRVRYYLQVVIGKPLFKPKIEEIKYLTIYPRVNLFLKNLQCSQSIMFGNHNRKKIVLNGTVDRLRYYPGESIHITLEISNPKEVLIKCISFSMSRLYKIGETSGESSVSITTLPSFHNSKNKQIKETFSIEIPTEAMPPSYKFQKRIEKSVLVNISYMLKLAVGVRGISNNFDVSIPITLGTEQDPDRNHQQPSNPVIVSHSSNPEELMFSDHDLLLSYDSVMQHTK